jgi:hypothetical protein
MIINLKKLINQNYLTHIKNKSNIYINILRLKNNLYTINKL